MIPTGPFPESPRSLAAARSPLSEVLSRALSPCAPSFRLDQHLCDHPWSWPLAQLLTFCLLDWQAAGQGVRGRSRWEVQFPARHPSPTQTCPVFHGKILSPISPCVQTLSAGGVGRCAGVAGLCDDRPFWSERGDGALRAGPNGGGEAAR
mgnify:CR=1 FL=1|jgi:hypothetical protein